MFNSILFATLISQLANDSPAMKPATPPLVILGRDSNEKAPSFYLAKSSTQLKTQLEKLNPTLNGNLLIIDVDFSKFLVVFVCSGKGFELDYSDIKVYELLESIIIRYRNEMVSGGSKGGKYSPFAIVLINKTEKTILIEEDVRENSSDKSVWKRRAVLGK